MESKFCGFRSLLLIQIVFLSSSCDAEMNVSNVEQCTDTVNIPRELYDVLTSILHKQVKEQQQGQIAVLEHRISIMENQLHIYIEDRQLLFQYAKVVTEALKRLMKLEEVTDSVTNGMQEMKDKTQYLENDFVELKNNVSEIEFRVKEDQTTHRDLTSNVMEYSMNCSSKIDSIELFMEDTLNNFTSQRNLQEQQINKRLMSLEDYFTNADREANTTMEAVASIQRDVVLLSEKVPLTEENMNTLRLENQELKQKVANLEQIAANQNISVAFSARLPGLTSATSSGLIFSTIISNIGGGYNGSDGVFYCPKDGLYLFSVTVQGNNIAYVQAYFMKNTNKLALLYEHGSSQSYQTASLTFALDLRIGDRIWIKGVGIRYYEYSFFTGILVK